MLWYFTTVRGILSALSQSPTNLRNQHTKHPSRQQQNPKRNFLFWSESTSKTNVRSQPPKQLVEHLHRWRLKRWRRAHNAFCVELRSFYWSKRNCEPMSYIMHKSRKHAETTLTISLLQCARVHGVRRCRSASTMHFGLIFHTFCMPFSCFDFALNFHWFSWLVTCFEPRFLL